MQLISVNTIILLFFILLVSVVVSAAIALRSRRKKKQGSGIQLIQASKILLTHMQIHRGLTAAYLSGDRSKNALIYDLRENIGLDISRLSNLEDWVGQYDNWLAITQHWARLSSKSFSMDADKSFDQHCRLIKSVLAFIRTITSTHYLAVNRPIDGETEVWFDMLNLSELMAQIRAQGLRILNAGDQSLQLHSCKKHIAQNIKSIELLVGRFVRLKALDSSGIQELESFIDFVKEVLLSGATPIAPDDFYRYATDVIERVFESFDREINTLYMRVSLD